MSWGCHDGNVSLAPKEEEVKEPEVLAEGGVRHQREDAQSCGEAGFCFEEVPHPAVGGNMILVSTHTLFVKRHNLKARRRQKDRKRYIISVWWGKGVTRSRGKRERSSLAVVMLFFSKTFQTWSATIPSSHIALGPSGRFLDN